VSQDRPFPPGSYPILVVGSGPGALQFSYELNHLGVEHAVISQDPSPGGLFRRFPLFQRLLTWSKPYAPAPRGTSRYDWYDWNSLLAHEPEHRNLVATAMDGTSYFPSRPEMEQGLADFAERAGVRVRYGCTWEATRRTKDGFEVETSDGTYRCRVLVLAVGMTEPWIPDTPGIEGAPHYADMRPASEYADKTVFILGKRNSGFEIATGLLPWARRIILASPRPARISVVEHTTAAARARYVQPYEDAVLGGGHVMLDMSIDRFERLPDGRWMVHGEGTSEPGALALEVDDVIVATGFSVPLGDLRDLGMATFARDRLPVQTHYWESTTVPGLYFAGTITQGAIGLKKHGRPSSSSAVHGFRYNSIVLARHLASTRLGIALERRSLHPSEVVDFVVDEMANDSALWHQQAYLARLVHFDPGEGITDEGWVPLAHFLDSAGPDAAAVTVETNAEGDVQPVLYVRRDGEVTEHALPGDPMLDFGGEAQAAAAATALAPLLG
jgi:thioredoxin reductase